MNVGASVATWGGGKRVQMLRSPSLNLKIPANPMMSVETSIGLW